MISMAMFVAMVGVSMVSPLLPIYVGDELGGPSYAVALSFSGLAIAQIIMSPWIGTLGDRFGLKVFISGGFAIYAVGAFGYLVSPTWELVVFFRILSGFGAAGVFPMTLAYIGLLSPPGKEGRYMGVFMIAQMAGFGAGPLLGGAFRDLFNADAAFLLMGLMLSGTAIATLLWLPSDRSGTDEPAQKGMPWLQILSRAAVQGSVLFMVLTAVGWGAAFSFLAIYVVDAEGLGIDSALLVGLLLSARTLVTAALQPLTGWLADRADRVTLVVIGLVLSAVGLALIPFAPGTTVDITVGGINFPLAPWLLVVVMFGGVGEAIATPAQQAIFVTLGRTVGMGVLMGLNNTGVSIGMVLGALVGAAVVDAFGLTEVFVFSGGILVVGVFAYLAIMLPIRHDIREQGATLVPASGGGVSVVRPTSPDQA